MDFSKSRVVTNKIIERLEEGSLSYEHIARSLLGFLSEQEVAEFAHFEELFEDEDEDEDD